MSETVSTPPKNVARVTADIWIDLDFLNEHDLGWDLSEDRLEDAEYLVRQAVDALTDLLALKITGKRTRAQGPRFPETIP